MSPSASAATSHEPGSRVRVLAWPGPESADPNQYTPLLYGSTAGDGVTVSEFGWTSLLRPAARWDIWHMHWPETVFSGRSSAGAILRAGVLRALIRLAKRRGIRIVWTVHNLGAHDRRHPRLEAGFAEWLAARVDGFISLSGEADRLARERLPPLRDRPSAIIPLGHYMDAYPNTVSREDARRALGLEPHERVILFFGSLRAYKNVGALIDAFRRIPDPGLRLVIAGKPGPGYGETELRTATGDDHRIVLHARAIPVDEVQLYMNASDLVALPFGRILNSASTMLALSFVRPVLVPAVPQMVELQQQVGNRLVRTYSGVLGPRNLLDALEAPAFEAEDRAELKAVIREIFDWDLVGARTRQLYRQVLNPRSGDGVAPNGDAARRTIGTA